MSKYGYSLLAPGADASSRALYAPGRSERRPHVDDRLAPPETRVEYLEGAEIFAAPAAAPHATQHFDLAYVLGAHVAKGYRGAVDMLTRVDAGSDYAPDASIFPVAPDPKTGGRKLEELAFEVADRQALAVPTEKARKLIARGVRRVFCILVKQRRVLEWSRETDGWQPLPSSTVIEDRCLVRPLRVSDLLDAASANDAVARALLDQGVPVLEEALAEKEEKGRAEGEREGKREGRAEMAQEAIIAVMRARMLVVSREILEAIRGCSDRRTLKRWLERAATVSQADEVLGGRTRARGTRAQGTRGKSKKK